MITAGLLLLVLAAPPSQAAPAPTHAAPVAPQVAQVPAQIEADLIRYNWTTRKVLVTGKPFVTLRRGDMTLTCRKLAGDNDEKGQLVRATCEGDVKLVRTTRVVTCERAQFDRDSAKVVCEGSPLLRDGETEARGKRLTYYLDADEVVLEEAVQAIVPSEQVDQGAKKVPHSAPVPAPGAATAGKPPATAPTIGPAPRPTGAAK